MKVQCPSCREIVEMADFTTSEAGLSFRCALCQQTTFLPAPGHDPADAAPVPPGTFQAAPAETPPEAGGVVCPKCGHTQRDAVACHRCGLNFAKFDPQSLPPDPPEAAALWEQILRSPQDPALHDRFVQRCLEVNRPDFAARRYRELTQTKAHRAIAEKMIERMLQAAQARLAPALSSTPRGEVSQTGRILFWLLAIAALGLIGYFILAASDIIRKMT